ncbi:MAG: ZIP family metal transporter [Anaerolineales bacterium]|nr:ZIP family metal transporter [Anaerolineales bacterium]MCW5856362.1 ZIP family metal transporter [Anaerolineales bacterium]
METSVWSVFWVAMATAAACGLGALPFFFVHNFSRRWLGIFGGAASGLMLGASFSLIFEALPLSVPLLMLGSIAGLAGIHALNQRLKQDKSASLQALRKSAGVKTILILAAMTIHSFAEGIGMGVAYGGGEQLGLLIAVAIAIQNIPEGLAIALLMVPLGTSPLRAAWWAIVSSLPQPLMAVPAFLAVTLFKPVLPLGLGLAAGAMLWMVFAEVLPEALEDAPKEVVAVVVTLSVTAMIALQAVLG